MALSRSYSFGTLRRLYRVGAQQGMDGGRIQSGLHVGCLTLTKFVKRKWPGARGRLWKGSYCACAEAGTTKMGFLDSQDIRFSAREICTFGRGALLPGTIIATHRGRHRYICHFYSHLQHSRPQRLPIYYAPLPP